MTAPFADRLIDRARALRTPLCVGLDPFPERIPAWFGPTGSMAALEAFSLEILRIAAPIAPAVKPQLGLYEAYGPEGYALARRLCQEARARGLLVILDAKRGDIGTTAEGYAAAAFGEAGFAADCVTVNPYMGFETLEPFLAWAEREGRGVAPLVRTSNPGAADLQGLGVAGRPLWERVAEGLAPAAARLRGSAFSSLMPVVGATAPAEAKRARALLPDALFLVPGYGAQGASASDALASFVAGPAGPEGGLVNASRAVLYPPGAQSAAALSAWREAVDAAMRKTVEELRAAGGAP